MTRRRDGSERALARGLGGDDGDARRMVPSKADRSLRLCREDRDDGGSPIDVGTGVGAFFFGTSDRLWRLMLEEGVSMFHTHIISTEREGGAFCPRDNSNIIHDDNQKNRGT
jgi:hypothetical protein